LSNWREQEIALLMKDLSNGAHELSEELLTALIELEDLRDELQFARDNPFGERDQFVHAFLKPLPHLNSGAIALPEPDEPNT
jgi:hypothetical protein